MREKHEDLPSTFSFLTNAITKFYMKYAINNILALP